MIPSGFSFSAVNAGVKSPENINNDMGLIFCDRQASVAGVFTTNLIKAAPVLIGMDLIRRGTARAIIVNSGNANACTGPQGIDDAKKITGSVAAKLGVGQDDIFPMSTGVIGVKLPIERILVKIQALVEGLGDDADSFARSIMTTDTFPKVASRQAGKAKVLGFAKGSGMIAPNMATTLAVVLTDARITAQDLDNIIKISIENTFNAVTIDGDTSTNDTLIALASGYVQEDISIVGEAIQQVIHELAMMIVKDGEGATKVVQVHVRGAHDTTGAKTAAMSVANSLLVKTAMFGCDPNWGRIMCAIGYSGVDLDPDNVSISIGGLPVVLYGREATGFDEDKLHKELKSDTILIEISLGDGPGEFTAYTTDLSYKYVEINAEYRS
jgi:glutamate N-acetyltransferase/amino-acid N-acetyltransferase